MPDLLLYDAAKNWLVVIEAVTSHGPIDAQRKEMLTQLFAGAPCELVFISAFLSRKTLIPYLSQIAWGTDVWLADAPDHLVHFNGSRFLGPEPHQ